MLSEAEADIFNDKVEIIYNFLPNSDKITNFVPKQKKFMATKKEIELFLAKFIQKVKIFGIIFRDDRGKNMQTLLDLEITPKYREDVIMNLNPDDYVEGPIEDTLNKKGEMWVFGKEVNGRDVYIKISMGISNSSAICISFHIAEYRITYKFK